MIGRRSSVDSASIERRSSAPEPPTRPSAAGSSLSLVAIGRRLQRSLIVVTQGVDRDAIHSPYGFHFGPRPALTFIQNTFIAVIAKAKPAGIAAARRVFVF
jgi:hypothetical protein